MSIDYQNLRIVKDTDAFAVNGRVLATLLEFLDAPPTALRFAQSAPFLLTALD